MSPTVKMLFLLSFMILSVTAQVQDMAEVTLTTSSEIIPTRPFTITCNADAVNVPNQYNNIDGFTIKRLKASDSQSEDLAMYYPYSPFTIQEPSHGSRNWTIVKGNAPPQPTDINGNTRILTLQLTINDAQCSDAGMYQCQVSYYPGSFPATTKTGYQNLTARASVNQLRINADPTYVDNQYEVGKGVILKCRTNGPPGLSMSWMQRRPGLGSFTQAYPFANDITTKDPVEETNSEGCLEHKYESHLNLSQLSLSQDEYTYICQVQYQTDAPETVAWTIGVTTNPGTGAAAQGGGGGGDDVGLIVGLTIGLLALIVIVLLLGYFFWYRKRGENKDNRDEEESDNKPDLHAPPPVFYSKPNKPPKDDMDDGAPVGMTNIALDVNSEDEAPARYANAPHLDQEPKNGPPGYATDDDNRRARYNRGYTPDDVSDQGDGNGKEPRDNYRRRRDPNDKGDRRTRGSRSRDHTDQPRSRNHSRDSDDTPPRDGYGERPTRPGRYSTDDGTDKYNPGHVELEHPGYGDPSIGTSI